MLVGQVQLLLTANDGPSLLQEYSKTVYRDIGRFSHEEALCVTLRESTFKLLCFLLKLFLFINFMGHHFEVKLEEIRCLLILVSIRFVDLVPELADILLDLCFGSLVIVALVLEVSDDEEKLLG